MTEITDDHIEWAVVNRLQKILCERLRPEYSVTYTYALFTTILCWTVQRIRTKGSDSADELAKEVLRRLKDQFIEDKPWLIETASGTPTPADTFIFALRDACAHGDGRSVEPFHVEASSKDRRELAGFTFNCGGSIGKISLREADLRNIGTQLANMFCSALRHSGDHRHDNTFGRDAAYCLVEAAE